MTPMGFTLAFLRFFEALVVVYSLLYLAANAFLILRGFKPVLDHVRGLGFDDLDQIDGHDPSTPTIAVVVAAFNEETTIVESLQSLMMVDYPMLEIVVVNDGSTDDTKACLRRAFGMRRRDLPTRHQLETATVHGHYEASRGVPNHVHRFIMVDKANGGRADANNAGLNACISDYFLLVDADCIVDPRALKTLVRMLQRDPEIVATGGQIGVINNCQVSQGKIVHTAISRSYLPLCQTLEYVRAFGLMRTGFSQLNSLMILSGAFMVMSRDLAVDVGGFLTGRSRSRLLDEYVGPGRHSVGEDMEIIVRMHRYLREHGRRGKVVHSPLPLCWTEVPDNYDALSKQRRRWHRGFLEILWFHRRMILNPSYGRIGMFAMPYLVWFELLGPYIETVGLILLPLLAVLGILDPFPAFLVVGISLATGVLQSLLAVMCATWMEPSSPNASTMRSLLGTDSWRDRLALIGGCFLSEMGYRQMTLLWRLHGTIDHLRGKQGWDKFARKGFKEAATAAVVLLLAISSPTTAHGQLSPQVPGASESTPNETEVDSTRIQPDETLVIMGMERRDGSGQSWWTEAIHRWKLDDQRTWVGAYQQERFGRNDLGIIGGYLARPFARGGFGTELRLSPGASFSPRWLWTGDTEIAVHGRFTATGQIRMAWYPALTASTYAVGAIAYLPRNWWWSNQITLTRSVFRGGVIDQIAGISSRISVRRKDTELRFTIQRGGESFLVQALEATDLRATVWGVVVRQRLHATPWTLIGGFDQRRPERGAANIYLHMGVIRSW